MNGLILVLVVESVIMQLMGRIRSDSRIMVSLFI